MMSLKQKIMELVRIGLKKSDIARKLSCTPSYVSRIAKLVNPLDSVYYFEYVDHGMYRGNANLDKLPTLCAIGVIVKETKKAIAIKQIWSKSISKIFRDAIIIKSNIITRIKLIPEGNDQIS